MSAAILLAAIIVIWACVLVPRWVHRTHDTPAVQPQGYVEAPEAAGEPGTIPPEAARPAAAQAPPAADRAVSEPGPEVPGAGYRSQTPGTGYPQAPAACPPGPGAQPDAGSPPEPRADDRSGSDDRALRHGNQEPQRTAARVHPGAPASRARLLRTRRRTLALLAILLVITAGCVARGLTPLWVIAPPAAMLGTYLLLLRVAAYADAENAARQAAARARSAAQSRAAAARSARAAARQAAAAAAAARTATAAPAPGPVPAAEVIDMTVHIRQDQLYDQYEDATARAIGD